MMREGLTWRGSLVALKLRQVGNAMRCRAPRKCSFHISTGAQAVAIGTFWEDQLRF